MSANLAISVNWYAWTREITVKNFETVALAECRGVAEDGYGACEIPIAHCGPFLGQLTTTFWQELVGQMRQLGVELISAHGSTFAPLDTPFDQAVPPLLAQARACQAMGIPTLVVHPVMHASLHVSAVCKRALQWDADIARAVADQLGDGPTRLAIENVPHNSFRYLRELFARIEHPRVGMCFDTGHYNVRPEGPLERVLADFLPRIIHLHLSDNDGLSDQHLPPGAGNFPWRTFFAGLPPVLKRTPLVELCAPILEQEPDAQNITRRMYRTALEQTQQTLAGLL